jgi:hypothetical protein
MILIEAFGLKIATLAYSERKASARSFAEQNWPEIEYSFQDFALQINPPVEPGVAAQQSTRHIDCEFSGKPCQAWSRNRDKSGNTPTTGSVINHPGYACTFDAGFEYTDSLNDGEKHGGISEQVPGFMERADSDIEGLFGGFNTPYELYKDKLKKRGKYVSAVVLNHNKWITEPPKHRVFVVYVDDYLGGKPALRWIINCIQD